MVRLIVIAVMVVLLSGCNTNPLTPTNGLVKKAIAIQLEQTQQQLMKQLDVDVHGWDIKHIAIKQLKSKTINTLPAYIVKGTYDLSLKVSDRQLQEPKKSFEVYMQLQREGKTWRLLQPKKNSEGEIGWYTYLIE